MPDVLQVIGGGVAVVTLLSGWAVLFRKNIISHIRETEARSIARDTELGIRNKEADTRVREVIGELRQDVQKTASEANEERRLMRKIIEDHKEVSIAQHVGMIRELSEVVKWKDFKTEMASMEKHIMEAIHHVRGR